MSNNNEKPEAPVISIFAKKKEEVKEVKGEEFDEEYFRKIAEANKLKKEKLEKERSQKNKKVTKDFNLK